MKTKPTTPTKAMLNPTPLPTVTIQANEAVTAKMAAISRIADALGKCADAVGQASVQATFENCILTGTRTAVSVATKET